MWFQWVSRSVKMGEVAVTRSFRFEMSFSVPARAFQTLAAILFGASVLLAHPRFGAPVFASAICPCFSAPDVRDRSGDAYELLYLRSDGGLTRMERIDRRNNSFYTWDLTPGGSRCTRGWGKGILPTWAAINDAHALACLVSCLGSRPSLPVDFV